MKRHPGGHETQPRNDPLTLAEVRGRATITVEQAGQLIGLWRGGAYQAAQRGDIPTIRIGRRLFVPVAALLRMLEGPTTVAPIDVPRSREAV